MITQPVYCSALVITHISRIIVPVAVKKLREAKPSANLTVTCTIIQLHENCVIAC